MKRDAEKDLILWKDSPDRLPLLIRGARQVGKSTLVEMLAKVRFKQTVTINFELEPQLKACFTSLDPQEIITKIQLMRGVDIQDDTTLLFLDEIQECPEAIMALRYFREKRPGLAVIGAGSLLEFALESAKFRMPVGRVQFLYLKPLSFAEFLTASGNQNLRDFLDAVTFTQSIDSAIHESLLNLLRKYLILGGMPAVLKRYFETGDMVACRQMQSSLLQTFRSDFGKYAKTSEHKYLQRAFDAAPLLVGKRVKYSAIDEDAKSRDIKNAIQLLSLAGIVQQIYATAASGLPLGAQINGKKFKLNFLDVGLVQNVCGLESEIAVQNDFLQINSGAIAEQFVGQELSAYADRLTPGNLFFWARDKRNSQAEVDFVTSVDARIVPVEVKAGHSGALKSLRIFLSEKKSAQGVRMTRAPLSRDGQIVSLPLYMIAQLSRLIRSLQ